MRPLPPGCSIASIAGLREDRPRRATTKGGQKGRSGGAESRSDRAWRIDTGDRDTAHRPERRGRPSIGTWPGGRYDGAVMIGGGVPGRDLRQSQPVRTHALYVHTPYNVHLLGHVREDGVTHAVRRMGIDDLLRRSPIVLWPCIGARRPCVACLLPSLPSLFVF